ncbi:MAG TPA: condensation domain-containing protein, partial [Pyrinomonadaceae bacterium]
KQLQEQQVEMRQYEYSPLVEVQGWSDVPRGVPLFETILAFENYPVDRALQERGGDLRISDIRTVDWNNFPVSVAALPGPELTIQIKHERRRFDAANILRMAEQVAVILRAMLDEPDAHLGRLEEVLGEADRAHQASQQEEYKNSLQHKLRKSRRKSLVGEG